MRISFLNYIFYFSLFLGIARLFLLPISRKKKILEPTLFFKNWPFVLPRCSISPLSPLFSKLELAKFTRNKRLFADLDSERKHFSNQSQRKNISKICIYLYFTRLVITLTLLGQQACHSQNKFFPLSCTIYY